MKLYGIVRIFEYTCFCYGNKGFVPPRIIWSKPHRRFCFFKGFTMPVERIVFHAKHNTPENFFIGCVKYKEET